MAKRTRRNEKLVSTEFLPVGIGLVHRQTLRDNNILKQVLPPDFPEKLESTLLSHLSNVAHTKKIDLQNPDWLAATLFSLALEHPWLKIVKKSRGGQEDSFKKVANDRSILEFFMRVKAWHEHKLNRDCSLRYIATKYLMISLAPTPSEFASVDTQSEEFARKHLSLIRRIRKLRKRHPDIVEKYAKENGERVKVEWGMPIPEAHLKYLS